MAGWYRDGTIAVVNGADTVTGTGTLWIANAQVGQGLLLPDGHTYEIGAISSDLAITIADPGGYQGTTVASGGAYAVVPIQGYLQKTYQQLASFMATITPFVSAVSTAVDLQVMQFRGSSPGAWALRTPLQYAVDLFSGLSSVTVASNTATDIGGVTSPVVIVSGTNTIAGFGTSKNCLRFVTFSSALSITLSTTVVYGSVTGTLSILAGDTCILSSDGSTTPIWTIRNLVRGSGEPVTPRYTLNTNGDTFSAVVNVNAGAAARAGLVIENAGTSGAFYHVGAGYTSSGINQADTTVLTGGGTGGIIVGTGNNTPVYFYQQNALVGGFYTNGGAFFTGSRAPLTGVMARFQLHGQDNAGFEIGWDSSTAVELIAYDRSAGAYARMNIGGAPIAFLLGGNTVGGFGYDSGGMFAAATADNTAGATVIIARHNGTAPSAGICINTYYDHAQNDTSSRFLDGTDNNGTRFTVYSNGNMVNQNNSYGAISDGTLKQDVQSAKSQWDNVKALAQSAVNYRLIKEVSENKDAPHLLGAVAQDWQKISPGLVYKGHDGKLGINYSVAYMKGFIALGEALVRIEALEAEVAAMKKAA